MSVKRAIVSLATERGNYYNGLARLANSLKGKTTTDFIGFMGEQSVGAPKHLDNPYAFKIYAIEYVRSLGYTSIMWLDCSVVAKKDVDELFDIIEKDGYIMQAAGAMVRDWCNEECRKGMGVTVDELKKFDMYGNAGFLGLNINDTTAWHFFQEWSLAMMQGYFKGSWKDHRHDMTCGSIIAHRLGMKFKPGDTILDYAPPAAIPKNDTIFFHAQGL